MDDSQLIRARALVARADWRWVRGLHAMGVDTISSCLWRYEGDGQWSTYDGDWVNVDQCLPDLHDPLTLAWCRLIESGNSG